MVFRSHSKVGILALALGAASISNGFSFLGNEDNSEQPNTPRISPRDIFAFINRKEQSNPQVSHRVLMNASYDYLQRKILAPQNSFIDFSNNVLGLAALLQNHPNRTFPAMDSIGSARHVMILLKRIIDGGKHDKNNHYARVHYGELLLRRVKNNMTDEEKLFGGKVLSQVDKHYTQVGTLYYVELILDHNFSPEGVSSNQIGQHCIDLLKSTYSHKRPRTDVESRAVALLTNTAQTQAQPSQSTTSAQPTAPVQTLPQLNTQPDNLHNGEFLTLRKQLERKATVRKIQEAALLIGGNPNVNLSVPNIEQERSEGENLDNVNAADPSVGQKRGRTDDDIDALFDDSVLNDEADNAPFFDDSDAERGDYSEGSDPSLQKDPLNRFDETYPDSDRAGANRASPLADTEMGDETGPQNMALRKLNGRDPDDDSSSTSSSDDDDDSNSADSDSSSDDESSSVNQRRYLTIYTEKQIQDIASDIGAESFQNNKESRQIIWRRMSSEQKAHFKNNPNSEQFIAHVRKVWPKKLSNYAIEVKRFRRFFKYFYTSEQIQTVVNDIGAEPFQNNKEGRQIIWRRMSSEQKAHFENNPNSEQFITHVSKVWSKKLSNYGIKSKEAKKFLKESYTDEQIQAVINAIGSSRTFQNNKEGRQIIWGVMTSAQKVHFENNPNSETFSQYVTTSWKKLLPKYGVVFKDAHTILREPYTDEQIQAVINAIGSSRTFQNNEEGRPIIWGVMTSAQKAHFKNNPNNKKFVRHVYGVWSKILSKNEVLVARQNRSNSNN